MRLLHSAATRHQRIAPVVNRPKTRLLTPAAGPDGADSILDRLDALDLGHRLFVKPRYGSSASGVCAVWRDSRGHRLIGPIELVGFDPAVGAVRLFNSLRVRAYSDRVQIETILRAVVDAEAVVEQWLPKASLDAKGFDLRIVVISGEARHLVIRSSRHPMTNLHLGSERGDIDLFQKRYGTAERAAAAYPDAMVIGVDVLLDQQLVPYVLELNSFGDLLPGITSRGQSTYEAVVDAMLAEVRQGPSGSESLK